MSRHYGLPFTLQIPTPMPSIVLHGIHATTTFERHAKFRCNGKQLEEIDRAAALCGMKRADYLRFIGIQVSKEIIRITTEASEK